MKRFLTLLVGLVATSVGYSAPTYTSYFNNTHTYTNATVVGTNFAGRGVFTNGITAGASTFTGDVTAVGLVVTNDAISDIPIQIEALAGTTNSLFRARSGGTNRFIIGPSGTVDIWGDSLSLGSESASIGPRISRVSGATWKLDRSNGSATVLEWATNGDDLAVLGDLSLGTTFAARDLFIVRDGANAAQLGNDSATASAQTLKGPDGSGTDKVGGALQLEDGTSTGTAKGGGLVFRTANSAGASASSLNTKSERFHAPAKFVNLTDATATTLFTIPVPATNYVGLTATVTIYATDGTDHQSKTSVITVDAIAKTTTITAQITADDNTTAASAGTLTCTYTAVDNTSNVLAVKAEAASSLTETVLRAKIVITAINSNGAATVTEF